MKMREEIIVALATGSKDYFELRDILNQPQDDGQIHAMLRLMVRQGQIEAVSENDTQTIWQLTGDSR